MVSDGGASLAEVAFPSLSVLVGRVSHISNKATRSGAYVYVLKLSAFSGCFSMVMWGMQSCTSCQQSSYSCQVRPCISAADSEERGRVGVTCLVYSRFKDNIHIRIGQSVRISAVAADKHWARFQATRSGSTNRKPRISHPDFAAGIAG